jgi:hypothetical protein
MCKLNDSLQEMVFDKTDGNRVRARYLIYDIMQFDVSDLLWTLGA